MSVAQEYRKVGAQSKAVTSGHDRDDAAADDDPSINSCLCVVLSGIGTCTGISFPARSSPAAIN